MDWKKVGKKLLFPPVWLVILLVAASAALLIRVFTQGRENTLAAYGSYGLSFYSLCVFTAFCVKVLPGKIRGFRRRVCENPLGNRYLTDRDFRERVGLNASLGISIVYGLIHLVSWYLIRSWWFLVLAAYYSILALMRFLLVGYVGKNKTGAGSAREWKRCRICGGILLLVNLSLSGAVLMILYQNKGYDYPGILIYVMALHTFYTVIHAVVEMVRTRKMERPLMTAAKAVSLCAALVSLLNLETAMFAQFGGDMPVRDQRIFIILTGAGVSATIVTLSVFLIGKATKEIRREIYGE